jgi:hypothetical protein
LSVMPEGREAKSKELRTLVRGREIKSALDLLRACSKSLPKGSGTPLPPGGDGKSTCGQIFGVFLSSRPPGTAPGQFVGYKLSYLFPVHRLRSTQSTARNRYNLLLCLGRYLNTPPRYGGKKNCRAGKKALPPIPAVPPAKSWTYTDPPRTWPILHVVRKFSFCVKLDLQYACL